ncbi:DUF1835 domain-containing protein [Bacillus sp. B1-b2]|uniref:DUF1835 domain-containing protein n=1 Tax=Bacillus sp. B1-b2 TaxID=2653201 RepID=UPI001261A11A|nr:DUF1835 domain-containing protein [Bacillus sp. B1-b2]KAB7672050.1 DUF1835 domain-containing protein [Bacillus sp. B1-b2]
MIDKLKYLVKQSSEEEVKSILFNIFLRIQMLEEEGKYAEGQMASDMRKIYRDYLTYKKNQENTEKEMPYKAVHIVFGDSFAGSLRVALQEKGLNKEEKIITFSDIFSIGPVWQLHEQQGINNRYQWLLKHINLDDEVLVNYKAEFKHRNAELSSISKEVPIIIWTGENAHEQTALRYALYLLKDKTNRISILNTTLQYGEQFGLPGHTVFHKHSGEISPDKIGIMYENNREENYITIEERAGIQRDWEQLSSNKEVLRIWKNNRIINVNQNYYDEYIITTLKRLHLEKKSEDFIKSARLIGEVLGHVDQYIGDQYFEYRVRHLIVNGELEIEGVPKAMRYYSVKLR